MTYKLTYLLWCLTPQRWPQFGNPWIAFLAYLLIFLVALLPVILLYLLWNVWLLIWGILVVFPFQAIVHKLTALGHLMAGNTATAMICFTQTLPDAHFIDKSQKADDSRKLQTLHRRLREPQMP